MLNPEIYWIMYWIILEWRWRSSHCVSFTLKKVYITFFIPFMKFGEREMQVTHFFGVSGSTWETIPVQDTIRVYSRQSTIIPAMIGHTCAVRHVVRLVSKKCQSFNAFAYDMSDMSLIFTPGPQRPRLRARGHQRGHGTSLEVISGHTMSFGRCGATPPCRHAHNLCKLQDGILHEPSWTALSGIWSLYFICNLQWVLFSAYPKLVKPNLHRTQTWKNRALSLEHLSGGKKPWLFRLYRVLHHPAIWGL